MNFKIQLEKLIVNNTKQQLKQQKLISNLRNFKTSSSMCSLLVFLKNCVVKFKKLKHIIVLILTLNYFSLSIARLVLFIRFCH